MKKSAIVFTLFLLIHATHVVGSVGIQFSSITGNVLSGFANASGTVTNGMLYGIVVDTGGNGWNEGSYTSFDPNSGGFLSTLSGLTDDYFWSSFGNSDSPYTADSTGVTVDGANGSVFNVLNIPFNPTVAGLGKDDQFKIIWFSDNTAVAGSKYGMFGDVSFKIPEDGQTADLNGNFVGFEGAKTANLTIQAIPEPSRVMLLGIGFLGLFFRRRR